MSDTPLTDKLINSLCPFMESRETMILESHSRTLEREIYRLQNKLESPNSGAVEYIKCPHCGEEDFDKEGLEIHYSRNYCSARDSSNKAS